MNVTIKKKREFLKTMLLRHCLRVAQALMGCVLFLEGRMLNLQGDLFGSDGLSQIIEQVCESGRPRPEVSSLVPPA